MENRRSIGRALATRVGAAGHGYELAVIWPAVKEWLRLPIGDLPPERDWMGLECATNGDRAEGVVASAETLAELPPGLAYKVAVMRTLGYSFDAELNGQQTLGVEAWYPADEDWSRAIAQGEWVASLPIGYSFWCGPGVPAEEFVRGVEATTFLQLALRKRAIRIDVFGTEQGQPDGSA